MRHAAESRSPAEPWDSGDCRGWKIDVAADAAALTRAPATSAARLFLVGLLGLAVGLGVRVRRRRFFAFGLLAFFFRSRFFNDQRSIDPFDKRDRRRITLPRAELYNPGVAAVPIRRAWRDIV